MEWSEQGMRLARLGRLDEARAAAARALELLPAFRYSSQFGV
jgi:Flp pilus assembly protein TadD